MVLRTFLFFLRIMDYTSCSSLVSVSVLKLCRHLIYSTSPQEGLQEGSENNQRKMTLLGQRRGLLKVLFPRMVDCLLLLISFIFISCSVSVYN